MKQKTLEYLLKLASRSNLRGDKLDNFLSDAQPWDAYDMGYDDGQTFLAMAILKMENNDELPERSRNKN